MPLYVTEAQVAELLTPADAIAAVAASFGRLARGVVVNPARVRAELPDGVFAVMPCVDHELGYAGVKSFAWLPGGTPFLVVLFSIEHARVEAIVEADLLGQLRTAAASAVAATQLARAGAESLGVFGCGRQAASHVTALRVALPSLRRVLVHGRSAARVAEFCRAHDCEPAGSAAEAGGCDIVVTATTAKDPVLRGEWLRDGAFVCAVGANEPASRELDNAVLERASFVCTDAREQARLEAGDLIEPVERGVLDWLEVHELQDVLAGSLPGRAGDSDVTLFKSNGLAAWDIAAAARVVELAR
ncbi:MAG TPA: ornithine cyclodeaminase family protein [Gaiellaceae bacterium]|nr:ornithine cyclodeaminase family protein [Gaiellaceae bacterium]